MKNVKQIRESYDLITEKEEAEDRKLATLVRAGLYDAKKLPALKKALEKSADKMTGQEKRMLLNLLDSLINQVVGSDQVFRKVKQNVQHISEAKEDHLSKFDPRFKAGYPTDKDIPTVLILKRKAIRVYPDNQKVALYYSQALDKYVTIPFSDIQTSINEAKVKTPEEKAREKEEKERQEIIDKHSTFSKSLKTSFNKVRGNLSTRIGGSLGSALYYAKKRRQAMEKAAVEKAKETPKAEPKAKETPKAESKAKETPKAKAKVKVKPKTEEKPKISMRSPEATVANANRIKKKNKDVEFMPKSIERMSKAKTKLEENFKTRVQQLREERQQVDELAPLVGAAVVGAVRAAPYVARGAMYLARSRAGQAAISGAASLGKKGLDKVKDLGRWAVNKWKNRKKDRNKDRKKDRDLDLDVNVNNDSDLGGNVPGSNAPNYVLPSSKRDYAFKHGATGESSWKNRADTGETQRRRDIQLNRKFQQSESVILVLKNMLDNNITEQTLSINEQEININNTVAKKIMHVYESVNATNKKKMEKMLNESAESFTKVLTFAIRQ
jgi:hypothetical protein